MTVFRATLGGVCALVLVAFFGTSRETTRLAGYVPATPQVAAEQPRRPMPWHRWLPPNRNTQLYASAGGGDDDGFLGGGGGGGGGGGNGGSAIPGIPDIFGLRKNDTKSSSSSSGERARRGPKTVKLHEPSEAHLIRDAEDPKKFTVLCSVVVERPVDELFAMLTDFDNFAEYLPELRESYRLSPTSGGKTTVFQSGVEKVLGLSFTVAMKLGMEESGTPKKRVLKFRLLESMLMQQCEGSSTISALGTDKSLFEYSITIRPKGMLPVGAPMEKRMKSAIPERLSATAAGLEQWRLGTSTTVLAEKPKKGFWPWR